MVRPTAQTIIGGLSVSSLITLFVTPVVYSLLNREKAGHPAESMQSVNSVDNDKKRDKDLVQILVSVFSKKKDEEAVNA